MSDDPARIPTLDSVAEQLLHVGGNLEEENAAGVLDELHELLASLPHFEAAVHALFGMVFQVQGRLAEREAAFREAVARLDRAPGTPGPAEAVVVFPALAALDREDEAMRLLRAAAERHPDAFYVHGVLVERLEGMGEWREAAALRYSLGTRFGGEWAVEHLQRAVELDPENPSYRTALARALLDVDGLDEAEALLAPLVADRPPGDPAHVLHADLLRRRGRLQEALERIEAAVAAAPDELVALLVRARVHADLMDTGSAVRDLGRALELDADFLPARLALIFVLRQADRGEEAVAAAEQLAEHAPSADSFRILGDLHLEQGDTRGALRAFARALRFDPTDGEIRFRRAEALRLLGRLEDAEELLDELVEEQPGNPVVVGTRAEVLSELGDKEEAVREFDRALALDDTLAWAVRGKAFALNDLDRLPELVSTVQRLLELEPDSADAQFLHGAAIVRSGRLEEGLAELDRAVETDPENGNTHFFRALALERLDRLDEALEAVEVAVRTLDPVSSMVYRLQADILRQQGRLPEALAAADVALKIDPTDALGFLNRGRIHGARGEWELAEADLLQTLNLLGDGDPAQVAEVLGWLGDVRRSQGMFAEALVVLDRAVELDPHSAMCHGTRGQVLLALGRAEEAEQALRTAVGLAPLDWVHVELADLLRSQGEHEEALATLDRLIQAGVRSPLALGTRGQVLRATGRFAEAAEVLREAWAIRPLPWIASELAESLLALGGLENAGEALAVVDAALGQPTETTALLLPSKADALRLLGRPDEALEVVDRYLAEHGDDNSALAIKAHVLLDLGGANDIALALAEDILARDADFSFARSAKVRALWGMDRVTEALAATDAFLVLWPDDTWALSTRVSLLCDLRRLDEALAGLGTLFDRGVDSALTHGLAGWCLRRIDPPRLEEALSHLHRAVEQEDSDWFSLVELAETLRDAGRPDEARSVFEGIVHRASSGGNAIVVSTAGWAALRLGAVEDAIRFMQDALQLDPHSLLVRFGLGFALLHAGRGELGVDEYEGGVALAEKHPDPPRAAALVVEALQDLRAGAAELPAAVADDADEAMARLTEALDALRGQAVGA